MTYFLLLVMDHIVHFSPYNRIVHVHYMAILSTVILLTVTWELVSNKDPVMEMATMTSIHIFKVIKVIF